MIDKTLSIKDASAALLNDELTDITVDIAEESLDAFLDSDSILGKLPVVKLIIGTYKTIVNVKDRFELKKFCVFLQQFQNGQIDEGELEKRRKAYENNEKWFYKEVENILIYLSRHENAVKAKLLAEIYIDYINKVVTLEQYEEYVIILDRIFINDISHLKMIFAAETLKGITKETLDKKEGKIMDFDDTKCERLSSLGLLSKVSYMQFGAQVGGDYLITTQGNYICSIINRIRQ